MGIPKRWRSWTFLAAFVLVAAFFVGASDAVKGCVSQEQKDHRKQAAEKSSPVFGVTVISRHCWGVFLSEDDKALTALATVGLLLVTASLAFYTARLWDATRTLAERAEKDARQQSLDTRKSLRIANRSARATRKAADAAKESADSYRASERAWVSFISIDISKVEGTQADTGTPVSGTMFALKWQNAGRTPAIHCRLTSDHRVLLPPYSNEVPEFVFPPDTGQRAAPLIPGVPMLSPQRFVADADIKKLLERKCKIFIYGRAEYDLAFKRKDESPLGPQTEVCMEIEFFGDDRKTGGPFFSFTPTGRQNSAR